MVELQHIIPGCVIVLTGRADGDISSETVLHQKMKDYGKTLIVPRLMHGSERRVVTKHEMFQCDALITTDQAHALGIRVADCLPIVCSIKGKGLTVIHGGWRSLLQSIVPLTLADLCSTTMADPQDIFVWIGPSIQQCCNTMQSLPIQSHFPEWKPYVHEKKEQYSVSLQDAVLDQCRTFGIPEDHLYSDGGCTYHETESYYSYRRWKLERKMTTGAPHFGVVAWMEE
ncbi:MAG: polyphenol oxidase family protein [Candidatus Pacebacteria bacterium]|nr:polyphenol oxidase family protein [Candidatus Paceibacterota bacterium]